VVRPQVEAWADAELARRIAAAPSGAAQAEEAELYRRFAPRVRLYGLKHLKDEAAAEDLAQQVLIAAIERLRAGGVRNPDEIASFILGTSRLMAGSLKRTERRRRLLAAGLDRTEGAADPALDPGPLDRARVARCLEALPERDRTVLVLTYYAERAASEIAQELDMSPGAVRVARHRALARLRACVGLERSA